MITLDKQIKHKMFGAQRDQSFSSGNAYIYKFASGLEIASSPDGQTTYMLPDSSQRMSDLDLQIMNMIVGGIQICTFPDGRQEIRTINGYKIETGYPNYSTLRLVYCFI